MSKYNKYALPMGIVGLFLVLFGTGYAFFNYTRTGAANIVKTGRIAFNSEQGLALNLTNLFPMNETEAGEANLDSVSVVIEGNTTYSDGEEYEITLVDVNNTVNGKKIPLNYTATYTPNTDKVIGTPSNDYWNAREDKDANIYTLNATGEVEEGKQVLVGYVDNGATGIEGTLTIKAYIDADRVKISDTYYGNATSTPTPTGPNDQYGTASSWGEGKVVLTTDEWNSLKNTPISFKIKAVSQEGIWVNEQLSRNDMKFFPTEITSIKSSLTEINFIRMSEENINTHSNLIDLTADNGKGVVKAWIDNNKLYVASPGETYFPANSGGLLASYTNVTAINFSNVNTSQVEYMGGLFYNDISLSTIDISSFDTSNVQNMSGLFQSCTGLTSVDISSLNTSNVTNMTTMFSSCTNLTSVNISTLGGNNLTSIGGMFSSCNALVTINMSGFNFGSVTNLSGFLVGLHNLNTVDLSNVNVANVTNMSALFSNDENLETIYVSNSWNLNNVSNSSSMFSGCTSIVGGQGTTFVADHVDKTYAIVDGGQSNPGYLTLKTN